jgi:hypothetical protein
MLGRVAAIALSSDTGTLLKSMLNKQPTEITYTISRIEEPNKYHWEAEIAPMEAAA